MGHRKRDHRLRATGSPDELDFNRIRAVHLDDRAKVAGTKTRLRLVAKWSCSDCRKRGDKAWKILLREDDPNRHNRSRLLNGAILTPGKIDRRGWLQSVSYVRDPAANYRAAAPDRAELTPLSCDGCGSPELIVSPAIQIPRRPPLPFLPSLL